MRLTVEVTQQDIERGSLIECRSCPVALALQRATGREVEVAGPWFIFANSRRHFNLPESVRDFVAQFDSGVAVQPFSFEIEAQP